MKTVLAAVMALALAVLCMPAGYCSDMVEYEVALTDVRISMPDNWHYVDRNIMEDKFFLQDLVYYYVTAEQRDVPSFGRNRICNH